MGGVPGNCQVVIYVWFRSVRLLGVHTQTRPVIISALWQYIKTHKLQVGLLKFKKNYFVGFFGEFLTFFFSLSFLSSWQDPHEREFVNCDAFLRQIFQAERMKFAEIPQRLNPLLHPPDPIVINHTIAVEDLRGPEQKKTSCYDIDVEVDDTLKAQMNSFLLSTASQQEIQSLDNKIHETVRRVF